MHDLNRNPSGTTLGWQSLPVVGARRPAHWRTIAGGLLLFWLVVGLVAWGVLS